MNIPQINSESVVLQDYFRMLLFGAGQSGKTWYIVNVLLPLLFKKYQKVFVITPSYNQSVYKKVIPKQFLTCIDPTKFDDKNDLEVCFKKIQFCIEQTKVGKDETGHDVYKWNSIVILDDVLSPKFSRSETMIQLFARFRHYQVSTIMTSNAWRVLVSPLMLNNTTYIVMFNMKGDARNCAINQLMDYFNYTNERDGKKKAEKIFQDYIENKRYGSLFLDQNSNKLYYN